MTTEDKLKEFIVMKYGSLFNFSKVIGFPHSTLVSILKRGVQNNIGILCTALHISVDALAEIAVDSYQRAFYFNFLKIFFRNVKKKHPPCFYKVNAFSLGRTHGVFDFFKIPIL